MVFPDDFLIFAANFFLRYHRFRSFLISFCIFLERASPKNYQTMLLTFFVYPHSQNTNIELFFAITGIFLHYMHFFRGSNPFHKVPGDSSGREEPLQEIDSDCML